METKTSYSQISKSNEATNYAFLINIYNFIVAILLFIGLGVFYVLGFTIQVYAPTRFLFLVGSLILILIARYIKPGFLRTLVALISLIYFPCTQLYLYRADIAFVEGALTACTETTKMNNRKK